MLSGFNIHTIKSDYIVIAAGVAAILLLIMFIMLIIALIKISGLKKKYKKFMENADGESIAELIKENIDDAKEIKITGEKNTEAINDIYEKLQHTYCKASVNKYDAFHEMGGKLSFAVCMLDKKNNGYVINVMHSNNGCFAYVKEIVNGESFIELGDEEKKAVDDAIAGPMGDVQLGKEINEKIQKDIKLD